MNVARRLVSKKKKRFQEDGFDLDLTYITDKVIAMGFPSQSMEGLYRNPMTDVVRFFETRHKDHYKIWNLCSERSYDPSFFNGMVETCPFDDHNAPPFDILLPFCISVDEWLKKDPRNVAAIHCKAGKGRTGVMICIYLVFAGICKTPEEALEFYAGQRTYNSKGVTIPSQRRYVTHFSRALLAGVIPPRTTLFLQKIVMTPPPVKGCTPSFSVRHMTGAEIYNSKYNGPLTSVTPREEAVVIEMRNLPLTGDVKFIIDDVAGLQSKKLLHFWVNTVFAGADKKIVMTKDELDGPAKDKKNKKFPADFRVELHFASGSDLGIAEEQAVAVVVQHERELAAEGQEVAAAKLEKIAAASSSSSSEKAPAAEFVEQESVRN